MDDQWVVICEGVDVGPEVFGPFASRQLAEAWVIAGNDADHLGTCPNLHSVHLLLTPWLKEKESNVNERG